jgi:hypothetical protein
MIECSRGPGPLLRFGRHTQQYGLNFSLNTRRRLSQLQLSPKKNLNFNSFFLATSQLQFFHVVIINPLPLHVFHSPHSVI